MDYRWDITPGDAGTDIVRTDDEARALARLVTLMTFTDRSPYNYVTYQVVALGFLLGDVGHDYTCKSAKCWRVTPMAPILCYRKAPPNWYSAAHAYRTRTEAIASLVNYHAQDGGLLASHRAALRAQVTAFRRRLRSSPL